MDFKQTGEKQNKTNQKSYLFLKIRFKHKLFSPSISENYGIENLCFNHTKCLYIKVRKKKKSIKINSY